jgi:hypothetical protein
MAMPKFDLSEILNLRYFPAPQTEIDAAKAAVFETIYASAVSKGPGGVVNYNCEYPKYEFLDYLVNYRQLLLHGSNNAGIEILMPLRLSTDSREWANRKAIYACSDAIFPIFYAILNRKVYSASLIADTFVVRRDSTVNRFYHFAIAPEMLERRPWTGGMVYIVARDSFEQLRNEAREMVDEWASRAPVPVLAKLAVSPADFPYLNDVQAHENRPPSRSQAVAPVDQELFDSYLGEYQAGPDLLIKIVREKGRLFAQASGYPSIELRPESAAEFALSAINGRLTFIKNEKGEVAGLRLQLSGQELAAVKKASGGVISSDTGGPIRSQ